MKSTSAIKSRYAATNDGSTWSKWDLHVHTPETKLSNGYKAPEGVDVWDKFIKKIDASEVKVFGITDYFSIDNYEKFLTKYSSIKHNCANKIFLPNIEFRLEVSVNRDADAVDIHVIFDDDTDIQEIKRFLDHLETTNIEKNGVRIPCSKLSADQFDKAAININTLVKSLKDIFGDKKCYIIGGAANNQGLRPDTNSPRKMNISDSIERMCDFLFGGKQSVDYYLQTNRYENGEISPQKPVVSACDAHSFEELDTKLGKGQFCTWIKSMPTFNGLRQILYEPDERVAIQITEPDYKEPHNVIKSISISDNIDGAGIFGTQKILMNKNLNTIIGGKSSGKSLLLYSLAESIDITQINQLHETFDGFKNYDIKNAKLAVEWADGTVNMTSTNDDFDFDDIEQNHKITYIPQLYINHLAEKDGRDELNKLVDEILLKKEEYKTFKTNIDNKITWLNDRIYTTLNTLMELRNELISISDERKGYGTLEMYDKEINELEVRRKTLNASSSFSTEELDNYGKLKSCLAEYDNKLALLNNDAYYLSQIQNEIQQNAYNLIGNAEDNTLGTLYKYSNKLVASCIKIPRIIEILKSGYSNIMNTINQEFSITSIEQEIALINSKKEKTEQNLTKYNNKITSKSELPIVIAKIEELKRSKNYISELDTKSKATLTEYNNIKKVISKMLSNRYELYASLERYINEKTYNLGSEINFSCKLSYELGDFKLFDYINKQQSNANIKPLVNNETKLVNCDYLPTFFLNVVKVANNNLYFKDKTSQTLKARADLDTVYSALVEDNVHISYDVTYKGDNLLTMSPGKKGTVLLILFLELNASENPILIDQPEDNLDNRTIYDLLCTMIRQKKKERQIIIVTHNANLVVNTDAENVIVANQEGQDSSTETNTRRTKFEYINGPIELSFKNEKSEKTLATMGIKQHIFDILEGGRNAFRLREQKYREE